MLQRAIQPAVDGEIVSGKFHLHRLPRTNERDVRGPHVGLDQQRVVRRHDLHDVHAAADHPPDGVDVNFVHRAANWGADERAVEPVLVAQKRLLETVEQ